VTHAPNPETHASSAASPPSDEASQEQSPAPVRTAYPPTVTDDLDLSDVTWRAVSGETLLHCATCGAELTPAEPVFGVPVLIHPVMEPPCEAVLTLDD
jgi:hypothetical protein